MSRPELTKIPLSAPCLLLGLAIACFALYTNYIVLFARPPYCDLLCPLLALGPTVTAALWASWLLACCIPAWHSLSKPKRYLSGACVVISLGSFAMLYSAL
jgi:hypothetical protein